MFLALLLFGIGSATGCGLAPELGSPLARDRELAERGATPTSKVDATAEAIVQAVRATPVPGRIVDGFPPRLDGRLEIDRAPCLGETMTLRSTLDFALDSPLATELGVTELRGELWLDYPSDILSVMTARPAPTRVEGHGRPGGHYAVVWEDVVLRAGQVDERTISFRSDGESFGHRLISSNFVRTGDGESIGQKNVGGGELFVRFGNQEQHPEAVRSLLDIGPDRPSRCATPRAGVDAEIGAGSAP